MKRIQTIAILGHNVPAEDQAAFLSTMREDVTVVNAFDVGALKDLLKMRAVPTYAVLMFADTLEEAEALAIEKQLEYFEQQDEVSAAVGNVTSIAMDTSPDKAVRALGEQAKVLATDWQPNTKYTRGAIVHDGERDYTVLHDHTSGGAYPRPSEDATFALYYPCPLWHNGYMIWEQPRGASLGDYAKGDIVFYEPNEGLYVSKMDGNSHEPTKDNGAAWAEYSPATGEEEQEEPTEETPRWSDFPDNHLFSVGDYFTYYGTKYEVLREFNKISTYAPPALVDNFYRVVSE